MGGSTLDSPTASLQTFWLFSLTTVAIVGLLLAVFLPSITAIAITALVGAPILFVWLKLWQFDRLLLALMFALSNIFLLHKILAVKLPNGDNLFGIRDVLIVVVVLTGLVKGRGHLRATACHPLIWPGLAITAMVPLAAVWGIFHSGAPLLILREIFTASCWLLAWVIAANVRDNSNLRAMTSFAILLGVLVAILAMLEILSGNRIQIVSTQQQQIFGSLGRNWPDGFIFMILAWFVATMALLTNRISKRWSIVFLVVSVSFLLTEMRGLLLSFVISLLCLLTLALVSRRRWFKLRRLALPALLAATAISLAAVVVWQITSSDVLAAAIERYQDLTADAGGRLFELGYVARTWEAHPLLGLGLGVSYRPPLPFPAPEWAEERDTGTFVHNIFGFYLVKFGSIGLTFFLIFCFSGLRLLRKFLSRRQLSELTLLGLGLGMALLAMIIEAQAGNIFGDIRQLPIAAIAVGLLVGYDRLSTLEGATGVCKPCS